DRNMGAVRLPLTDVDRSGEHDCKAFADFAGLGEGRAGRVAANVPKPPQPFDLGVLEHRKGVGAPSFDRRLCGLGHELAQREERYIARPTPVATPERPRAYFEGRASGVSLRSRPPPASRQADGNTHNIDFPPCIMAFWGRSDAPHVDRWLRPAAC